MMRIDDLSALHYHRNPIISASCQFIPDGSSRQQYRKSGPFTVCAAVAQKNESLSAARKQSRFFTNAVNARRGSLYAKRGVERDVDFVNDGKLTAKSPKALLVQ